MPVSYLQQPYLLRASKTFTGAANLGAVGVNELFTTTGAVLLDGFWVRCTTDLVDTVDGALFTLGLPSPEDGLLGAYDGAFDLDSIDNGYWLLISGSPGIAVAGWGDNAAWQNTTAYYGGKGISANIIMTISTQAITGGVLEFYVLWRPLSADGNLALGAGMVAI